MRRLHRSTVALLAALMAGALAANATEAERCRDDAMLVFDASGSMSQADASRPGETLLSRLQIAKAAVSEILPDVTRDRRAGLIVYGPERSCQASLKLAPQANAAAAINEALIPVVASGATPISHAIELARDVLRSGNGGTIVLVTDGEENCSADVCTLTKDLAQGAKPIRVHVVGFRMGREEAVYVSCLARNTGGLYVPAASFDDLKAALRTAIGCLPSS
jgi:Ca-activated chloride channel homolog